MTPNTATTWPIADLHGWDKNPRGIKKEDFERLKRQIKAHGQFKPVLVTPDGEVLGGNMRLKAYQALGIQDVWVSIVHPKDDTEKVAIALADNDRAGYYEEEMLAELLMSVPDLVLEDYYLDLGNSISAKDLLDKYRPTEEDNFDVEAELPDEAASKLGDVFQLGNHRLMCGDSTNKEQVLQLVEGVQGIICITDPPYGLGDSKSEKNNYSHYDDTRDNLITLIDGFLHLALDLCQTAVLTPGNANLRLYPEPIWTMAWFTPAGSGRGPWGFCCWQPILCYGPDQMLKNGKGGHPDAIVHTEVSEKLGHPCPKPIQFWSWLIDRCTIESQSVYDPFGGSGTGIIACEQLGRSCYMMELDPRYCDVIIKRWEQFTGEKAIKVTA